MRRKRRRLKSQLLLVPRPFMTSVMYNGLISRIFLFITITAIFQVACATLGSDNFIFADSCPGPELFFIPSIVYLTIHFRNRAEAQCNTSKWA